MSQNEEKNIDSSAPLTRKGVKTRAKLLQIAEQIFGEKGYFNTSIVDITQQAEVAQGTFYKYFPSKKAIFEELIRELSRSFRHQIQIEVSQAQSEKEAQMIGFRTFFRWVKDHRNLYSIVQQTVLVDEGLYRWYYERVAQGYIKGLSKAMDTGEFKRFDPETLAYILMGMSQFIGMRWVFWENQDVPDRVIEDMMTAIFEGIGK